MPLDRLVPILVIVLAAAAATIGLAALVAGSVLPPGATLAAATPVMLAAYVVWRAVARRLAEAGEDPGTDS